MARLALTLLGPMRITLDEQPVSGIAYHKARALLAYLAIEAERPHPRDALVGLLWPALPDTAARTNLRQVLANLREAIGDVSAAAPFLLITRDTIQLNPASDYDLDVAAFTALLATCATHAHRHRERCRSCAGWMEQAITRYHGDFLAEFALGDSAPFDEWALRQRERLHQQALDTLVHLANYHERRGDDERARRYAQHQIALDPWREEAHRQLMRLLAHGGQRSAALAQYETCRRILAHDLDVAPEAATTALYERIRDGKLKIENEQLKNTATERFSIFNSQFSVSRHNFPAQTSLLIGRETELAELGALLENPACRLITIVGTGGMGKTRLALAAGIDQAEAFCDGAVFVPLAAISAAAFVAPAILAALAIPLQGQRDPRDQLLEYLRGKELLLVLDNFEQLLEPGESQTSSAIDLLADMLRHAPGVLLLITSRERLALPGEWLFDLSGLSYPAGEPTAGIETYNAVQLFLQRASQVRRQFALANGEARIVVRICQLVEGLPLAIELAAASLRTRSCTAIAEAIERNLSALAIELRAVPERHRSMWATFEHSWRLLSNEERQVFPRLAVFRGGFEEDAATQVAQASPQLLAALLDKSLLRWDGVARYDVHELLRQYAAEKLEQAGETEPTQGRHAEYYLVLAEAAEPEFRGPQARAWMDLLETDLPNVRAALTWSQAAPERAEYGLRLASALLWFWDQRSLAEGDHWLKRMLARPEAARPTPARAKALSAACFSAEMVGDYSGAQALGAEALDLARALRDPTRIAWALCQLGNLRRVLPDQRIHGMAQLEESLVLFKELDDHFGIARALYTLGDATFRHGDTARSIVLQEDSLARFRAIGDRSGAADPLRSLGEIALEQGNVEHAVMLCEESLVLCREVGDRCGVVDALYVLGRAKFELGDLETASALLAESLTMGRDYGTKSHFAWVHNDIGTLARFGGRYAEAAACYDESVALFMDLGRQDGIAAVRCNQGILAYMQGDDARAAALLRESLALSQALQRPADSARCLTGLAGIAARHGRPTYAGQLMGATESLLVSRGNRRDFVARADYQQIITTIGSRLSEATFAAAWAAGRALTLEQAIAYALQESAIHSVALIAITAAQ